MALPKLNQTPSYELTIPSTKETLKYRPFLVKEQKILLMALETQDEKQILRGIYDTLHACLIDNYNILKLKMFDIEYIFIQIRGKSIGESAELTLKCAQCEADNPVKIPLTDIKLSEQDGEIKNKINIGTEYVLNLGWPNFKTLTELEAPEEGLTQAELLYQQGLLCLESLDTADEKIYFAEETKESKEEFMGSLTSDQFNDIIKYAGMMPSLSHDLEFNCNKCNETNTYNLRGIQDFF